MIRLKTVLCLKRFTDLKLEPAVFLTSDKRIFIALVLV